MSVATAAPSAVPMIPQVQPPAETANLPSQAESAITAKGERTSEALPYWGDRFALVFWLWCFALMGLMHVIDLILSLFR